MPSKHGVTGSSPVEQAKVRSEYWWRDRKHNEHCALLTLIQRNRCYLCKAVMLPMYEGVHKAKMSTLDHVASRPFRQKHGQERFTYTLNSALACYRCNAKKGGRDPKACEIMFGHINCEIAMSLRCHPNPRGAVIAMASGFADVWDDRRGGRFAKKYGYRKTASR